MRPPLILTTNHYLLLGKQPTTIQNIMNTIKNNEYPNIPEVTEFIDII